MRKLSMPSTVQFNEQVTACEYPTDGVAFTFDTDPSTSRGNVSGIETSSPTQGDPSSSQPGGNDNAGGDPNSNDSNGNGGNQGGTGDSNDPQGPVPDRNYLNKLVFSCCARGGPLQHWGIEGRLRVTEALDRRQTWCSKAFDASWDLS